MVDDYADRPGWKGEPLFEPERFAEIAVEADRRGLQIAVHAIGDGAVRIVLDGYEAALQGQWPPRLPPPGGACRGDPPRRHSALCGTGRHRLDAAAAPAGLPRPAARALSLPHRRGALAICLRLEGAARGRRPAGLRHRLAGLRHRPHVVAPVRHDARPLERRDARQPPEPATRRSAPTPPTAPMPASWRARRAC